jgi:NADH dehydrogenase [ubiquinone] 1 alpha subcomplex assembly factor 1
MTHKTRTVVLMAPLLAILGWNGARGDTWYGTTIGDELALYDFDAGAANANWPAVNDGVMGGRSLGASRVLDSGVLEFYGSLSLANNGGFASIRSRGAVMDLQAYDGVLLRVRGDGRTYSLSVRTDLVVPAGAYYADLDTEPGVWRTFFVPFDAFVARSFGQELSSAPPLNRAVVRSVGFILADKQEGLFSLEVDWLRAVQVKAAQSANSESPGLAGTGHGLEERSAAAALIDRAISIGVPLFNEGNVEGCAATYEIAIESLLALSRDSLPEACLPRLQQGLAEASESSDPRQRAWNLRHALDDTWRHLALSSKSDAQVTTNRVVLMEDNG